MKINLVLQKTLLLLIMLNFVSYSGICQQPFCGTKADPYNSIFALPPNLTNKPGPTGPYFIKLNLYNIKKDDGSGGVSLDTINMALDLMEQDFSPHNIFFVRDCAINDIFVSEFQYTQDHYLHNSVWDNPDCSQNDGINIFFAPFDLQPGPGNAFTPPVLPTNKVWIGSREGNIPTILTKTFSHEIGHCLGLFHTFYNMTLSDKAGIPCCESEEPLYQQGTRDTCGDYVSDTHADPRYWYSYFEFDSVGNKIIDCDSILFNCSGMASQNIGCFADPNSFCPPGRDFFGIIFSPPYANIMSYQVENACREGFTTGQGERMRLIIDSSSLLQQVLVDTALFSCCGTDSSIVLNNTTYSECITRGQFPSPPGTVYVVNGTFEIDQDATFNDYQFVFSSCGQSPGEIKINSNIKATFKSCDLYGCKTMWKGITAGTSSKLYLINSNISDAYYAIEGLPQSNIFINGTNSFLDNYIGIKGYSISNLLVNGVTFDFQEFKPNYFGMPSIGIKTWAGIEISKSSIIEGRRTTGLVSNSCNFFNLYNGIITEDSDVHITYPRFENILGTTPGFSFPLDGYGIKSIGTGNTFYLRGYGKYSSTKTFNLVTVGVSLSGMALDQILDCKMENLEVGIHCSNTVPAGTLSAIVSNNIESSNNGILLIGSPQSPITISNNIFHSYDSSSGLVIPRFSSGTHILPYLYWPQSKTITPTIIENNIYNVFTANFGVRVIEGEQVTVQGQNGNYYFKLYSPQNNKAGISFLGVKGIGEEDNTSNYIRYNTIIGTANSNAIAVESKNSNGLTTDCNFTDSTTIGFSYSGQHTSIYHKRNDTKEHNVGLYLDRFAEIGQQYNYGNSFSLVCDTSLISGCNYFEGLCESDQPLASAFFIKNGLVTNHPQKPFPVSPVLGEWFREDPSIISTNTCNQPDSILPPPPPAGCEFVEHDYWVVLDTMIYSSYPEERRFINQQLLFDKIVKDSCFEILPYEIEVFYNENKDSLIGQLWAIKNQIQNLFPSGIEASNLASINGTIREFLIQIEISDSLIENGSTLDSLDAENKRIELLSIIDSISLIRDTLADSIYKIDSAQIDSILIWNNQINCSGFLPAINQKIINNIWLNLLKRDSTFIDSSEISSLTAIAELCPEIGGLAVVSARNLLIPFKGDIFEDLECGNENNERKNFQNKKNIEMETFDIFPNPNTGNFTVLYNNVIDQNQKIEIKVYDFLGRIEKHYTFSGINNKFSLSLDGNPKGTYFVEMFIDSKSFGIKKVIITN